MFRYMIAAVAALAMAPSAASATDLSAMTSTSVKATNSFDFGPSLLNGLTVIGGDFTTKNSLVSGVVGISDLKDFSAATAFLGIFPTNSFGLSDLTSFGAKINMTNVVGINFSTKSGFNYAAGQAVTATTPAVPEPATWAMMILGMGVVGYALRRQRTTVRFAQAV